MKKWISKRFDNSIPRYGFLSEFQKTVIVIGIFGWIPIIFISIEFALLFEIVILAIVFFR